MSYPGNRVETMDLKLELIPVPVSDVDQAKKFYVEQAGSACSISIGTGITEMAPGTMRGLQLVVADIEQAKAEFEARGLDVGEVQDYPWGRFVFFADPDGNTWAVQGIVRS
jgi:predicted enzyme related to lactoylglutathione lyase